MPPVEEDDPDDMEVDVPDAAIPVDDAIAQFEAELDKMSQASKQSKAKCARRPSPRTPIAHASASPHESCTRCRASAASAPSRVILTGSDCGRRGGGGGNRRHGGSKGDAEEEEDEEVAPALRYDATEGVQPACIKNGSMRHYQVGRTATHPSAAARAERLLLRARTDRGPELDAQPGVTEAQWHPSG